jgi:hypothetical protein
MLYELRRYEAFGHNQAALHARFADHTTRIFGRLGFRQVGYFETIIGDGPELTYLLGWKNLNERQEAWDRFHADPEWHEARRSTGCSWHGRTVPFSGRCRSLSCDDPRPRWTTGATA